MKNPFNRRKIEVQEVLSIPILKNNKYIVKVKAINYDTWKSEFGEVCSRNLQDAQEIKQGSVINFGNC